MSEMQARVRISDTADGLIINRHDAKRFGLEHDKAYRIHRISENEAVIYIPSPPKDTAHE